jgi:hypothetical protein
MFFYKVISPEQSYATALRQDSQYQQPQAPQKYGENRAEPHAATSATTGN